MRPPTWLPSSRSRTVPCRCGRTSPPTAPRCARCFIRCSSGTTSTATASRSPTAAERSARAMREFNMFNPDRQLAALQTAVTMLRPLPEQKTLIYFGSGLSLNGSDNMAQLRATDQRGPPCQRHDQPDRRPGSHRHRRRSATPPRRPLAAPGCSRAAALQSVATSSAVDRTRCSRSPRTPAARRCSTPTTSRSASSRRPQAVTRLLHRRLLQHAYGDRRQVPARARDADRRTAGATSRTAQGYYRRQDVCQLHHRRTRNASSRKRFDARGSDHRDHDRYGAELLPAESRGVLRAGGDEDSRAAS